MEVRITGLTDLSLKNEGGLSPSVLIPGVPAKTGTFALKSCFISVVLHILFPTASEMGFHNCVVKVQECYIVSFLQNLSSV